MWGAEVARANECGLIGRACGRCEEKQEDDREEGVVQLATGYPWEARCLESRRTKLTGQDVQGDALRSACVYMLASEPLSQTRYDRC